MGEDYALFLMIDNIDSFVWNLVRYLELTGVRIDIRRNDQLDLTAIERTGYQGIILSPGPGKPAAAGQLLPLVRYFTGKIPILGVCLGYQAIAEACGARIICADSPMHGKLSLVQHDGQGIFQDLPNPLAVTRYHSLIVERSSLPADLAISCETADGTIMGLRHVSGLMEGVQFHPEAELTECGLAMVRNFVRYCIDKPVNHWGHEHAAAD
jgi:para-aminobenzoate synthetase component 2